MSNDFIFFRQFICTLNTISKQLYFENKYRLIETHWCPLLSWPFWGFSIWWWGPTTAVTFGIAVRPSNKKVSFDFLGYTFRPNQSLTEKGLKLTYFPCMSTTSKNEVRQKVRKIVTRSFKSTIQELAQILNPKIRGWYQYYCKYSRWTTEGLWYWINQKLVNWIMDNRRFNKGRAIRWLRNVYQSYPTLFGHWSFIHPY